MAVDLPKTIYISGESVLFRVSVMMGEELSPSKMAYAELIDRKGQTMSQEIIRLHGHSQLGYIDLPEDLLSDHYLLRIYTKVSMPSGPNAFHQFVTVINPKRPPNPAGKPGILPAVDRSGAGTGLLEKAVYGTQEQVSLTLPSGNVKNMSISIAPVNPFLGADLAGPLEKRIYQEREAKNQVPEIYGHIVKGTSTRQPVDTTETFFLSAHGSHSALFTAKPNTKGELYFDMGSMDQVDFVIVQSQDWENPLRALVESPFPVLALDPGFEFPELHVDKAQEKLFLDLLAAKEVSRYYYAAGQLDGKDWISGLYPDQEFLLDDYNRFEDFATVIREYVPKVRVRRQDRKTIFKVFDDPNNTIFDQNPLILLDAMPVFDSDALARFDPEKIKSLKLIYRNFYLNQDVFSGVISLSSYENDFAGFPIPDQALYIPYSGPQRQRDYGVHKVMPEPVDRFHPDFRTLLLWHTPPAGQTEKLVFQTSEVRGLFQIRISYEDEKGERKVEEVFGVE